MFKKIYRLLIVLGVCLFLSSCTYVPHTHEYLEDSIVEPSCEDKGYTLYKCSCGSILKNEYVDAVGHTEEVVPGYPATYETPGMSDGVKCSSCDKMLVEGEIIPVKEELFETTNVVLDSMGGKIDGYSESIIILALKEPTNFPNVSKDKYLFKGWLCSFDNLVYESFPGFSETIESVTFSAVWEYDVNNDYEMVNKVSEELALLFSTYDVVNQDLVFNTYDTDSGVSIKYSSSDESIISNEGKFTRPYESCLVDINVLLSKGDEICEFTHAFNVAGYKKLENIASTYVYTEYHNLTEEFFETMDVIYCAFVSIDVDGGFTGVDATGSSIAATNKKFLAWMKTYVIPYAHAKGVYVVASIGGGGSAVDDTFEEICLDNNKIDTLTTNIVNLINEYGFDGVDIDWEKPNSGCEYKFTNLTKSLYTKVKANNPNHLVTAAIGGGKWQPPRYDLNNSKNYLDYINMMTYSMTSNSGYHHSALYKSSTYFDSVNKVGRTLSSCSIEESVEIYKDSYGIEANQIIIGGAFYGYTQTRKLNNGSYTSWSSSSTISYNTIKNYYLTDPEYEYFYDTNCEAPYLLSKDKLTFITYDDPRSIKAKCDYLISIDAAGIMFWQNGHDGTGDLIKALKEGLKK